MIIAGAGEARHLTAEEINKLFTLVDIDGDNKLTRREFKLLISRMTHRESRDGVGDGNGAASAEDGSSSAATVSNDVLMATFVAQAIPFLGFGFMDNVVMILAGEYIEMTLGAAFTLSTMGAAGLGNLFSDILGVGVSNKIEIMAERMGFKSPELTKAQRRLRGPKIAKALGAVIGISVGCLIGMFPLLFFDADHNKHDEDDDKEEKKKKKMQLEAAAAAKIN